MSIKKKDGRRAHPTKSFRTATETEGRTGSSFGTGGLSTDNYSGFGGASATIGERGNVRISAQQFTIVGHHGTTWAFGHGYSEEQLSRGRRVLRRAEAWRLDNPDAWGRIERHALELAARGERIGAQALIEAVRQKALVDRWGNDTRTDNSFAPIFARWLATEHPECAPFVELRRSVFDVLIGGRS